MKDSNKAILSSVLVFLFIVLFSCGIILPQTKNTLGSDTIVLDEMQGRIDYVICGASYAKYGFSPEIIDDVLGVNSFNLSYDAITISEKKYLLQRELERNPVDTVFLELSYDALTYVISDVTYTNYNSMIMMDSFVDRVNYWINYTSFANKGFTYALLMQDSIEASYSGALADEVYINNERINKGHLALNSIDISLSYEESIEQHDTAFYDSSSYAQSSVQGFSDLINMCKSYGCRVIIVVTPVSDTYLWRYSNLDDFECWLSAFCNENDVDYYDFNLLKTRYDLFDDATTFVDDHHLSGNGAEAFSTAFAEVMREVNAGNDVSSYFYDNYSTMRNYSPYNS